MRLTTRLMQLASWLLLQRAVNEGELTQDQARSEKTKVKLTIYEPPHEESMKALPKRLRTLIDESRRLHDHVLRMDALIYGSKLAKSANDNPVEHQLGLLRAAFEAKRNA
jgi:regulator of CtrA degradation